MVGAADEMGKKSILFIKKKKPQGGVLRRSSFKPSIVGADKKLVKISERSGILTTTSISPISYGCFRRRGRRAPSGQE